MPQAITFPWRSLKATLLILGLAGTLTACNSHNSGSRGAVHYSERSHWQDHERHRARPGWHYDRRHTQQENSRYHRRYDRRR